MMLFKVSLILLILSSSYEHDVNDRHFIADAFTPPLVISSPPTSTSSIHHLEVQTVLPRKDNLIHQQYEHSIHPFLSKRRLATWIRDAVGIPPAGASDILQPSSPPTQDEITLLRQAFAAFYGTARDYTLAEKLLSDAIDAWQRQPPDEQAGLYRVRGDCEMALLHPEKAIEDYTKALELLKISTKADPAELPASYMGRARAIRSLHTDASTQQRQLSVSDYNQALKLLARDQQDGDTDQELLEDGGRTNPYATWEYGMALRLNGQLVEAQQIHQLASQYFDDIGDPARATISLLDAGIDAASIAAASSGSSSSSSSSSSSDAIQSARTLLKEAIGMTKTVEGRDIALLQRVIAKEGEGRMALASIEWTSGDKSQAENQLGLACERLDQLEADAITRNKFNPPPKLPERLLFNIDDGVGALDISCTRLRNKEYLNRRLEWPNSLQEKVGKLYSLSK